MRALVDIGLEVGRLELRVTESVLIRDFDRVASTLRRLRGLGVRIGMDDFGTGYLSLAYLRKLPFSSIKIDRGFVAQIEFDAQSPAIVRSIIGLGHALNLRGDRRKRQNAGATRFPAL